jgi:hypothetical protein
LAVISASTEGSVTGYKAARRLLLESGDRRVFAGALAISAAVRAACRMRCGRKIVGVGVSGALAGNHAHAAARGNSLRGRLHHRLIHHQRGRKIFEIKVGVVAAGRKRRRQVAIAFDLADSKYSISGEYNKCLLHLWSSERNFVRRVLDAEEKQPRCGCKFSAWVRRAPPASTFAAIAISVPPPRGAPPASPTSLALRRALERNFPGWTVVHLTTSMDLQRSFGPAYLRGSLRHGQRALAVVGVNDQETQSTIDGALTIGILWLEACRLAQQERRLVEGLVMVLPKGTAPLTRQRMAHLHPTAREMATVRIRPARRCARSRGYSDCGNLATRLVHSIDEEQAATASAIRSRAFEPFCRSRKSSCSRPRSLSFRWHGLEFAQARIAHDPRTFESTEEIVFGMGPEERVLTADNESQFADLVRLAAAVRHKDGPKNHALWRMHPERWLESLVVGNLAALDGRLRPEPLYAQVPAFAAPTAP